MKTPHFILEVANVHGGEKTELIKIVNKYSKLNYANLGIKFQPFKYDMISLKDFDWYDTYKELYFNENEWSDIIDISYKNYTSIWLDLFDLYSVEILNKNIKKIYGLKLQASVLENLEIFNALLNLNLSNKKLMINVSGYEIKDIEKIIDNFKNLNSKELIIQIGYQSYPTKIEDSALNKIPILKNKFPLLKLCFADHISYKDSFSQILPSIALMGGCDIIEKHICLKRSSTKYDFYSSLEYNEIKNCLKYINNVVKSHSKKFISKAEDKYLKKSIQKPVLSKDVVKGKLISKDDLYFRRTNQNGISYEEICEIQSKYKIISRKLSKDESITASDYKKAKIGVIVACRLKSSRLRKKALLPINNITSIERCLDNCLMMHNKDVVVLATSTLDEDKELKKYTLNGKVKFWQGDPDDVISRYIGACDKYNIDTIIRVTADCCLISPEITDLLLESHFQTGADYSAAREFAVGTAPEIYNLEALKRVISLKGKAEYSEYMTWYMQNNKNIFKVNNFKLPNYLVRNYRLTLDYKEDLRMFKKLYNKLDEKNLTTNINDVFSILDKHPEISKINNHLTLKYMTDKNLIKKLNVKTKIHV